MALQQQTVIIGGAFDRRVARRRAWLGGLCVASSLLMGVSAQAAEAPGPVNVVNFTASASAEVVKDLLTVSLAVMREGADAAVVQSSLKQTLDAALTEARKHAQAQGDALEVRTGSFNVGPRYGANGRITGWQGSAELVLEGRDIARVASTAGKLTGMTITSSAFSVSRTTRDKSENELTALAIQKFRSRATEVAKAFGFGSYSLREVQVQGLEGQGGQPVVMMARATSMKMSADEALPVEGGKSVLTATVQGSVVLGK